ncbi:hypothetical protein D5086_027159 [Populus alba]|uniref:Uncharacterized protein n=1 Tax=Populus alba TaxID=43335 RepID=A0ACC4B450_POPAL
MCSLSGAAGISAWFCMSPDWLVLCLRLFAAGDSSLSRLPALYRGCSSLQLLFWSFITVDLFLIMLALEAPPLSHTVHVTVPPNSNSPHKAPAVLPTQSSRPVHQLFSTDRADSPNHGELSPSINHIFMDDYSDDEEIEEEADLDYCGEDYVNGSKFFTSSPLATSTNTPPIGSQFTPIVCPTSVIPPPAASLVAPASSPVYAMPAHAAAPRCAMSVPIAPTRDCSFS